LSAQLITEYSGLAPRMTPNHPLWGALFRLVWTCPVGNAVILANALSAVFGGLAAWFLFHVVSTGILRIVNPNDLTKSHGLILARIAGVVATLALCFSSPFWIVATRAHSATFDMVLILFAVSVLMAYARGQNGVWLYVLAFTWGIGTVEYASFIVFSPLVLILTLLLMWKNGELRPLPAISAASCWLMGLSLYLVAAWHFYGSAGYEIREYPSFFKVVWFMWRDQYRLITSSLPREGWLIII